MLYLQKCEIETVGSRLSGFIFRSLVFWLHVVAQSAPDLTLLVLSQQTYGNERNHHEGPNFRFVKDLGIACYGRVSISSKQVKFMIQIPKHGGIQKAPNYKDSTISNEREGQKELHVIGTLCFVLKHVMELASVGRKGSWCKLFNNIRPTDSDSDK